MIGSVIANYDAIGRYTVQNISHFPVKKRGFLFVSKS